MNNRISIAMSGIDTWEGEIDRLQVDFHIRKESPDNGTYTIYVLDIFDLTKNLMDNAHVDNSEHNSFEDAMKFLATYNPPNP